MKIQPLFIYGTKGKTREFIEKEDENEEKDKKVIGVLFGNGNIGIDIFRGADDFRERGADSS